MWKSRITLLNWKKHQQERCHIFWCQKSYVSKCLTGLNRFISNLTNSFVKMLDNKWPRLEMKNDLPCFSGFIPSFYRSANKSSLSCCFGTISFDVICYFSMTFSLGWMITFFTKRNTLIIKYHIREENKTILTSSFDDSKTC